MNNKLMGGKKSLDHAAVLSEIKLAKKEGRPADFSNKTVDDFSVLPNKIRIGLNLENTVILNPLFLINSIIEGDLNLRNAKIGGSLYLGGSEIKGNLILEETTIGGAINLVGLKVKGNIMGRGLINSGFVNLMDGEFNDVNFESAEIKNAEYEGHAIQGDLFIDSAVIKGSLNISKAKISGRVDLDNSIIEKDLIMMSTRTKEKIDTTTGSINGRKIT